MKDEASRTIGNGALLELPPPPPLPLDTPLRTVPLPPKQNKVNLKHTLIVKNTTADSAAHECRWRAVELETVAVVRRLIERYRRRQRYATTRKKEKRGKIVSKRYMRIFLLFDHDDDGYRRASKRSDTIRFRRRLAMVDLAAVRLLFHFNTNIPNHIDN